MKTASGGDEYERQRRYERRKAGAAADIGTIPPVRNPKRRDSCRRDLHKFLVSYFPETTGLKPFSLDHKRVIAHEQQCVLHGGLFENLVYRGFAKTTIAENTTLWATLFGHWKFVPIFGATADKGENIVESVKMELSENPQLYDDFPEICHPIRCLDGKSQRCASQTYSIRCDACGGVAALPEDPETDRCKECGGAGSTPTLTHIEWSGDTIVFPTLRLPRGFDSVKGPSDGAPLVEIPGAGAIIIGRGLTGSTRGMTHKRPDGTQQRPDGFLIDDPQTDESAASQLQVHKLLSRIKKSILKLGGHRKRISGIVNATVIERNDLTEHLADAKENPAWQVERIKMVRAWAGAKKDETKLYLGARAGGEAHKKLWLGEYQKLRNSYDRDNPGDQQRAHRAATAFYKKNRKKMDAGCEVSWEHCYQEEEGVEISAIQHAYNMLIDDGEEVFASECQNEPIATEGGAASAHMLSAEAIAAKLNRLPRGIVPATATHLVAFIDPKFKILPWVVCAFDDSFNGDVVDYGAFPDQSKRYYSMRDPKVSLADLAPVPGMEAQLAWGLDQLTDELLGRDWMIEGQGNEAPTASVRIEKCLIDANLGPITDLVKEFCRRSKYKSILVPSHGMGITARQRPMREYSDKPGDRKGNNWRSPAPTGRAVRHVVFDSNAFKSFVHDRFSVPAGSKGCLSLFGEDARRHQLFADHQVAEKPLPVTAKGRTVIEWIEPPSKPDNDFLDSLVGCHVAAAMLGVELEQTRVSRSTGRRVKFSDIMRAKRLGLPSPLDQATVKSPASSPPAPSPESAIPEKVAADTPSPTTAMPVAQQTSVPKPARRRVSFAEIMKRNLEKR